MAQKYDLTDLGASNDLSDLGAVDAMSDSPLQDAAAGAAKAAMPTLAELSRQVLPTAGGIAGAKIGFAAGSPLGPAGMAVGALGGAYIGGVGGQSIQSAWEQMTNQRGDMTPNQVISEANRAGLAQAAGELLGMGAGNAVKMAGPGMRKIGAQVMRATAAIPEREGAAVLRDPGILSRAQSLDDAAKTYLEGTGGVRGGVETSRQLFGKSYLNPEQAANAFDELWPVKDAMSPDEVLALRQRMMKAVAEAPYKQSDLRRVLSENISKIDAHLETKFPDWTGARQAYREAKIGEEFSSWLPLNKNTSPNVLRTWTAAGAATEGLRRLGSGDVTGLPLVAALPLISPKVWGMGIRASAASAPVAGKGIDFLARIAAGQYASTPVTVTK